jgi:hypothetical protein
VVSALERLWPGQPEPPEQARAPQRQQALSLSLSPDVTQPGGRRSATG